MAAFLTPANTYYDKDWDVHVGSGETVRAHFILTSNPNCDGDRVGNEENPGCTGNPYPEACLFLYNQFNQFAGPAAISCKSDQNWQFVSATNSGPDAVWKLRVFLKSWNGTLIRHFAIAWNQ
jgi:hypothetical protein